MFINQNKIRVLSITLVALTLGGSISGCSAKISTGPGNDQKQQDQPKNPSYVNYVQCSNPAHELIIDVTSSQLEIRSLNNNVTLFMRDITLQGSTYSITPFSGMSSAGEYPSDPSNHVFNIDASGGSATTFIEFDTHDYKTGTARYKASSASTLENFACNYYSSKDRPAPLAKP